MKGASNTTAKSKEPLFSQFSDININFETQRK